MLQPRRSLGAASRGHRTCAHVAVGRVGRVAAGEAHLGGVNAFLCPELSLGSPETAHALKTQRETIQTSRYANMFPLCFIRVV